MPITSKQPLFNLTFFKLLSLILLVAGCAAPPKAPPPVDEQARQAMERGDYHAASRAYLSLALKARPPLRQQYQLMAAETMLETEQLNQTEQILQWINIDELNAQQAVRYQLLSSRIALFKQQPEQALRILAKPLPADTAPEYFLDFHQLRAQAYNRLGNHLETAREHLLREQYLTSRDMIFQNQQAIWQNLSLLSETALKQLSIQPPPDPFSGWIALVSITKATGLSRTEIQQRLKEWQLAYPDHPVQKSVLDNLLERSQRLISRPNHIALLLPLSGRFAKAGEAVRDGILATYYGDDNEDIKIRIYDTASDPKQALATYDHAIEQGAEFVIGPLEKESTNALAQRLKLAVTTLTLNYSEKQEVPSNMFQFALPPENEARQAAEQAWLDGHSTGAVLVPEGAWGERVYQAFEERWLALGGQVVAEGRYDAKKNDFSTPLKQLLNLNQSEQRHKDIQNATGKKMEYTPRRRQDIDFIFIAAFPKQARLLRPQIKFHHASKIPVYATSHAYSGKIDRNSDRDMDGIIFGDMPWTLGRVKKDKILASYSHQLQRLIALGVDAYQLIPQLGLLAHYPHERFQGVTGSLRVDPEHRVQRQLIWSQFKRGIPRSLEELRQE